MSAHLRIAAVFGVLTALLAACGPTTSAPGSQSAQGSPVPGQSSAPQRTLVIGIRGEPPSIAAKPLVAVTGALAPPTTLFDATLDYADAVGTIHPYLSQAIPSVEAGTWRVLPDGRMETDYKLKPNLTWQDGTPLTAEDFIFAWRVYATPVFGAAASPPISQMEEVTAADPQTVTIHWKETFADAGALQNDFQALPEHILSDQFQQLDPVAFTSLPFWTQEYVGLGPYRVTSWEPGTYIQGEAFDGFVLGKPKIDKIVVQFFADSNTALAAMLAGQVHFVGDFVFSATDGVTLEQRWASDQGGTVLYAPVEERVSQIQLRPEYADPPALLDVRVRKALAYAIDNVTANEVLSAGKGLATLSLSSPQEPYYSQIDSAIEKHAYDPRQTQQLLEQAGFAKGSDGFFADSSGKTLTIPIWSSSGAKNEQEQQTYADSIKRAGINTTNNVFSAVQLANAQGRALINGVQVRGLGQKRLEIFGSDTIPGPNNNWQGENRGGWSNPAYDQALAAYTAELNEPKRIQDIAQMERVFSQDVGGIPNIFSPVVNAYVSQLTGPIERKTPESGIGYLGIEQWQWKS